MAVQIKKAVRERIFLKLVATGPAGSGKTKGAIALAKGLAPTGKIGVIDTENRSASYYASEFDFDVIELEAPFTTQKYLEALRAFIDGGYEAVVIDSLTHEWAASGGILDQKSQKDARGGNSFTNWNEMKQLHNKFVEVLLQSHIHVVCTLRSKMEYVMEQNDKGKSEVRKLGLAPISSDGMEYEFGVMFDVDRNSHLAIASKDRTGLFEGRSLNLVAEPIGRELRTWLESGAAMAPATQPLPTTTATATATHATATPAATVDHAPATRPAQAAAAPQAPGASAPTNSSATARVAARPTQAPAAARIPSRPSSPAAPARTVPSEPARLVPEGPADFTQHPDWPDFVEAMADLAQASMGMPERTRSKLVELYDQEGPTSLAKLQKEIQDIKSVMPGGAFTGMTPPAGPAIPQSVDDVVDDIQPDTDEGNGGITPDQYALLIKLIAAHGIDRDALRAYCLKLNYLLPGANGPTLARMTTTAYTKLREDLANTAPAPGGKETWAQRRVRVINSTPTTTYSPIPAAS